VIFRLLLSFFLPFLLLFSTWGWGTLALGSLRFNFVGKSEDFFLKVLIGFGVLGSLLLVFGLAGFFYPATLWIFLVLGLVFLKPEKIKIQRRSESLILIILAELTLFCAALRLNVPVTTADELSYHLYLPKIFLLKHTIFYWPYHVNSAFPLLAEIFYSYGVSLASAFSAKSVHFIFGILTSFGLYSLSRASLKDLSPWRAALLFLTVPIVNHQMALANNDLILTAFLLGAYLAIFRWQERGEKKWLFLAGALSGFAMGVKYLALFAVGIQTLLIIAIGFSEKKRFQEILSDVVVFGLSVIAVSGVWYVRSYLSTGNPFYPYLTHRLGGTGLENPLQLEGKGFGKSLRALLLLPWHVTFSPEPFGGAGNQWGPIFLGFLPGVFFLKKDEKPWKLVLGIAILSFILWFYSKQNLRFLLPALPFFCLIVSGVLERFEKKSGWVSGTVRFLFMIFIALHLGIAIFRLRDVGRVSLALESRENYLTRTEPTYPVASYFNHLNPQTAPKILSQEHRAYYFNAEVVRERAYRRLTHYDVRYARDPGEFYKLLLKEGFTHLLISKSNRVDLLGEVAKKGPHLIYEDPHYFLYQLM